MNYTTALALLAATLFVILPSRGAQEETPYSAPPSGLIGFRLAHNDFREIAEILPDSPADGAGIQRGDYVLAVDARSTAQMTTTEDLLSTLRGAPDSAVQLTLRKGKTGETVTLKLRRMPWPRRGAADAGTLKTEYNESAINGSATINFKQWKTSRQGKVILTHETTVLMAGDTFDMISTIIFHDGHKILQLSSSLGKRLCSFQPQADYKALLVDADNDGIYDGIVITDARDRLIDSFTIAPDGRVTPISDAELQTRKELEQRERKG